MKLGKELLLFSLVSIIFLAGCAKGPEGSAGAGVIITSFAPDVQSVDAGSSVTFVANLKNVGGKTSIAGKASFFGLSNDWSIASSFVDVLALAPADSSLGLSGEETSLDFTSTATTAAAKGADVTYDLSVRVMYGYTTTTDTLLRFITSDYQRTVPNTPKGIQSSTTSSGPLLVTATARTPTLSVASTQGRVQFEIQNIGSGRVIKAIPAVTPGTIPAADLDIIKKITISGVGTGKCADKAAIGGVVTLDATAATPDNIRLAGGKSKVISCNVDVSGITNFKDIALKVTIEYNYFVDSTTAVTVLKALE